MKNNNYQNNINIKQFEIDHFLRKNDLFLQWLVGFVDGDGSFTHNASNDSYSFRISQNAYNTHLLYIIKHNLGFGEVYLDNRGDSHYVVASRDLLINYIVPIFDTHILRTTKGYNYIEWRTRLLHNNFHINIEPHHYADYHCLMTIPELNNNWIIGFFEAEGSLHIIRDKKWVRCGFNITQGKENMFILHKLRLTMNIKSNISKKSGNSKSIVFHINTMSYEDALNLANRFGTSYFGV